MAGWDGHLVAPDSLGVRWDHGTAAVLGALVAHVRRRWPLLQEGIRAMEGAARRTVTIGEGTPLPVELFHNPARLSSVVAVPSADAWCPLCAESVPEEEQGLAVGRDMVALPNPAPIIRDHVVFAHRDHVPQALEPCLDDLAWLLSAADEDTAFLYNGPTSGASSPFHRHLQAGRARDLPLTAQRFDPVSTSRAFPWGCASAVEAGGRRFIFLTIPRPPLVPEAVTWALRLLSGDHESPLNLILWRRGEAAFGALFPRSRHRPSCFFLPEDRRIVVSPGSVEMAGLVVVPRRKDWECLTSPLLAGIYREVGMDDQAWRLLCDRIAA